MENDDIEAVGFLTSQELDQIIDDALADDPTTSVVDIIVELADSRKMEVESVALVISNHVKDLLRRDFMDRRMLEKKILLPFDA